MRNKKREKHEQQLTLMVDIVAVTEHNSCSQLPGSEKRSSLLGRRMPTNSTGTRHCVPKGISFAGTMSDVVRSFYEKCRSRFHFFLLRRPVKVGDSDKDINSARRLKWSENLISQCCTYGYKAGF